MKNYKEKTHLNSIQSLGCIICESIGLGNRSAEIHHVKDHCGMGRKASHFETIPLCPEHHRHGPDAYHVSPKEFTEKYGTQRELLQKVQDELNITGCKCGCASAFNESFSGL